MHYITPKFSVGQTVYQYEPELDAMFRGRIVGIQATSTDAQVYGLATWTLIYEVQFHGERASDWVPESELTDRRHDWPELAADEPAPIAVPDTAKDAAAHG